MGFAPVIGDAFMELLSRIQEEHENERAKV
jgi:hypothetical protein